MQSWEEQSQGAIYTVEYACRYCRLTQSQGCILQHRLCSRSRAEVPCASLMASCVSQGESSQVGV